MKMDIIESMAQYGIGAMAVVACAVALWTMYKMQMKEREKTEEKHAEERQRDEERYQRERMSLADAIARQHAEAIDVTRRSTEVTTELITFLRAKIN